VIAGGLWIPDVDLPDNIDDELRKCLREIGKDDYVAIAYGGVEHPEKVGVDPRLLQFYACVKYLEESPENGLVITDAIAWILEDMGRLEDAIAVLAALEKAGSPGCWTDVCDEDPAFVQGWLLANHGRHEEALACYRRAAAVEKWPPERWILSAHVGSVHHEMNKFAEAAAGYREALEELRAFIAAPPEVYEGDGMLSEKKAVDFLEGLIHDADADRSRDLIRLSIGLGDQADYED